MNFFLGLFLLAGGVAALYYNRVVFNFTGRIGFVESRMPGNSLGFIKLVAVLCVVLGLLFVTGLGSWLTQPLSSGVEQIFGGLNS